MQYKNSAAPLFPSSMDHQLVTFCLGALASIIKQFVMYIGIMCMFRSFYRLFIFKQIHW